MFMLFLLLGMAYAQDEHADKAPTYVWATGFALINLPFLLADASFLASVISVIMLALYAWGYFALLRRFSDHVVMWLLVCLSGLILLGLLMVGILP